MLFRPSDVKTNPVFFASFHMPKFEGGIKSHILRNYQIMYSVELHKKEKLQYKLFELTSS